MLLGGRELGRPLEDHRARDIDEALDVVVERRAGHGVVEAVVDLGEGVGKLVEVRDAPDDRRAVNDMTAPRRRLARVAQVAQIGRVDLTALAHPLRRLALIGDPDLEARIGEQTPDDRRSDEAGAAGDQDAIHGRRRLAGRRGVAPAAPFELLNRHNVDTVATPKKKHCLKLRTSVRFE